MAGPGKGMREGDGQSESTRLRRRSPLRDLMARWLEKSWRSIAEDGKHAITQMERNHYDLPPTSTCRMSPARAVSGRALDPHAQSWS
jgi:hypothetical protein